MANVSKKEFEALKDSINAWVAATSSLFDCHKNRMAKVEEAVSSLSVGLGRMESCFLFDGDSQRIREKQIAALEARLAAAEKAEDKSIADLSARVDALARTVGVLAEKQSAARQTNDSVGRIAEDLEAPREKPTQPKPKCPWCGGEADYREWRSVGFSDAERKFCCTNPDCRKAFWV